MRAHLIVDCGVRLLSALLLTPEGQLVPCSQQVRGVAMRHVPSGILLEPRAAMDHDFMWEETFETLARAGAQTFFQRARRIGLRRPWDPQASADALQLTAPLSVLSSAAALADRMGGAALPGVALALLDALFEPILASVDLPPADVDLVAIVPAQTGRTGRVVLRKLFRQRGFRGVTIIRREIAAAMALIDQPAGECSVIDASSDHLHLHRVAVDGNPEERRFRTVATRTIPGLGWSHWVARIAAVLGASPSSAFDRSLIALLSGSPDSALTYGAVDRVLDGPWIESQRREVSPLLPLRPWTILTGEIFALDAVSAIFGGMSATLDRDTRAVALAIRRLQAGDFRRLVIGPSGTLRIDTLHGEAVELVSSAHLPEPGEGCLVEAGLRLAGEAVGERPFLLHLLWGSDDTPEGNATLCAVPLPLRRDGGEELRVSVHLRRSRSGRRLNGAVEARQGGAVAARARFTEELEVRR
jgi:hypothetical protein